MARSILHKKVRQVRASTIQPTHPIKTQHKSKQTLAVKSQQTAMEEETKYSLGSKENTNPPVEGVKKSPSGACRYHQMFARVIALTSFCSFKSKVISEENN